MRFEGTQEFIASHQEHNINLFSNDLIQTEFSASVEKMDDGRLLVLPLEERGPLHLEAISAYLFCTDCEIEQEINLFEVAD
jgi:hypothetical protein